MKKFSKTIPFVFNVFHKVESLGLLLVICPLNESEVTLLHRSCIRYPNTVILAAIRYLRFSAFNLRVKISGGNCGSLMKVGCLEDATSLYVQHDNKLTMSCIDREEIHSYTNRNQPSTNSYYTYSCCTGKSSSRTRLLSNFYFYNKNGK